MNIKRYLKKVLFKRKGVVKHPWLNGFSIADYNLSDSLPIQSSNSISHSLNLTAPILFLARGHSGTRALAEVLKFSGVYIGDSQDADSLNPENDSLYWAYGFQRTLLPKLFIWGQGCLVNQNVTINVGLECLRRHFRAYTGGPWGFKTCAGMFCFDLYNYLFPDAKYIYLVRDGRDVILSNNGRFHLTQSTPGHPHWEYFKIITFGINNDMHLCPFKFPEKEEDSNVLLKHKYWIQAKSWKEHVHMVNRLTDRNMLLDNVKLIKYEELCTNPISVLDNLYDFLGLELSNKVKDYALKLFHTSSIERWKNYHKYVNNCGENMESVFQTMKNELNSLGYD